jgi:import inner membrane translocase subunit TIM44
VQGQYTDATLLDVSEVELADVKFLEDDPVIVVQFNCQQINCVRDKFGNVVDGAQDCQFLCTS